MVPTLAEAWFVSLVAARVRLIVSRFSYSAKLSEPGCASLAAAVRGVERGHHSACSTRHRQTLSRLSSSWRSCTRLETRSSSSP